MVMMAMVERSNHGITVLSYGTFCQSPIPGITLRLQRDKRPPVRYTVDSTSLLMAWFKREGGELDTSGEKKVKTEGLWVKCDQCRQIIWKKDLDQNMNVCT